MYSEPTGTVPAISLSLLTNNFVSPVKLIHDIPVEFKDTLLYAEVTIPAVLNPALPNPE